MGFFDWLESPGGLQFTHAIIVLVLAYAAYVSSLAHQQSRKNAKLLNGHLEQHIMDAAQGANTGALGQDRLRPGNQSP